MPEMQDVTWFHSIDLGNGQITNGFKPHWLLAAEADTYFRTNIVKDKTVLDIGAWDGFMSFEAERRGAKRVLATDHFCWSGPGWGTKAGFNFVHDTLGSKVESVDVDVFDLDPASLGTFDVVLFPGVLYHLTDPYGGLAKAASMTHDLLIVETATAMNHVQEPVMRYYLGSELSGDPTNFWAPNELCLRNMLKELGFTRIQTTIQRLAEPTERLIAHAWKS
jgi:tRNA (mo5U34)-methyltransferase